MYCTTLFGTEMLPDVLSIALPSFPSFFFIGYFLINHFDDKYFQLSVCPFLASGKLPKRRVCYHRYLSFTLKSHHIITVVSVSRNATLNHFLCNDPCYTAKRDPKIKLKLLLIFPFFPNFLYHWYYHTGWFSVVNFIVLSKFHLPLLFFHLSSNRFSRISSCFNQLCFSFISMERLING